MLKLSDREKYCTALLIIKGGNAHYEEIRNVVLDSRESFDGLSDRYLKYSAVKRNLGSLVKQR